VSGEVVVLSVNVSLPPVPITWLTVPITITPPPPSNVTVVDVVPMFAEIALAEVLKFSATFDPLCATVAAAPDPPLNVTTCVKEPTA
jgi:hypothetical protein